MTDSALRQLSSLHGRKPTGLYLWEGRDHEVYIGISNSSVTARLRQHVRDYPVENIQSFRYRQHQGDRATLREVERELIYGALDKGFTVVNREHSAVVYGTSVFDERMAVERQAEWFKNPVLVNGTAPAERVAVSSAATARARRTYEEFSAMAAADSVTDAIALYLRACVPLPFQTEREYWSLTCLPSWSKDRLATLNMGYLEMFYVHANAKKELVEIYIGTDYSVLPRRRDWWRLRKLGVRRMGPIHQAGLPNEEVVQFRSVEAFVEAMQASEQLRLAAARFALDRMRKGRVSGRYQDAHNALLAGAALERASAWKSDLFLLDS